MGRYRIVIGERFGSWTVVGVAPRSESLPKLQRVIVRCDCGSTGNVQVTMLKTGRTTRCRSCGSRRHGLSSSPEHRAWEGMQQRCLNPNNSRFGRYGARGITVCARWMDSFENFYEDMGPKPSPQHSIDRIDANGHYEPGNCRWADDTTQARNHVSMKLNATAAVLIRHMSASRGQSTDDIAHAFGVSCSMVSQVRRGDSWSGAIADLEALSWA